MFILTQVLSKIFFLFSKRGTVGDGGSALHQGCSKGNQKADSPLGASSASEAQQLKVNPTTQFIATFVKAGQGHQIQKRTP